MLEACRCGDKTRFFPWGETNVHFAAHEAVFAIPARSNPIGRGQGRLRLDGLGVDGKGRLVVFEFKGPQDNPDPISAIKQGLLGAIAVYAKWKNVLSILRKKCERRPALSNLKDDPKVVVCVAISSRERRRRSPRITRDNQAKIHEMISSCPFVKEVSLARVDRQTREEFHSDNLNGKEPWLPELTVREHEFWKQK